MLVMLLALLLASCGTRAPRYDYRQLAKAAVRLDMDIDAKDNHRLYIEVADWIGTPYRHGGTTRKEPTVQVSPRPSTRKCIATN